MNRFLAAVIAFGLVFAVTPDIYGAGSRPSGGSRPSYSSGSRPSFSSSRPSYSKPSTPSYSKPSTPSGGSKPSYSKPSTPSGSSKPSYSSGSGSKPSTPSVAPAPSSGTKPGSSYSSGGKTYTPAPSPSAGSKPKGGAFDGNAAAAQKRQESKSNFVKGSESKPTYTSPTGKSVNIDNSNRSVQTIRSMNHTTYITRETRIYSTFGGYYGHPVVVYNDPFNTFFWYWMLDRSLEHRAMWAYHHRTEMDTERYKALLAKDAKLEARIKQLEAEKLARDPGYVPPGLDPDLQYTDDYVDAVYNPHTVASPKGGGGFLKFLFWTFMIILGIVVVWLICYMVFVRRF